MWIDSFCWCLQKMVKEMMNKPECNSSSSHLKQNHVLVKFVVSAFLVGVAFSLLYTSLSTTTKEEGEISDKCDLSFGEWVPDPSGPLYTNETCRSITRDQNCMTNGRPDSGYLYWRWKPQGCEIQRFNAERFLQMMRDKSWGFIGGSITRNQVQSLLCLLSQVETANQVYHDKEWRSYKWHFPSYNFTLSVIWSPFLLKSKIEGFDGPTTSDIQLYLDELDEKWTNEYQSFNYVTLAGGSWYLKTATYHEKNTVIGCHNCADRTLTKMGIDVVYPKAMKLVLNFISNSNHNAVVFLRTTPASHYENGGWNTGGTCNRTVPYKEGEISLDYTLSKMRDIELEEFKKAAATLRSETQVKLNLLDITHLSLLRPDGHAGPYRVFHPGKNTTSDCQHWCLPGPVDSWNYILMEELMRDSGYSI